MKRGTRPLRGRERPGSRKGEWRQRGWPLAGRQGFFRRLRALVLLRLVGGERCPLCPARPGALAEGAAFVPQLFEKLGVAIKSVVVARPTLDDVFLNFTGSSLRDAEQKGGFNAMAARFRGR